jgi:hypothetical protein
VPDALAPRLGKAVASVEGFFLSSGRVNGIVPETRAAVRAFAERSLDALAAVLAESPFLAGTRPGLADVALWGFLDAGLLWEPKPKARVSAGWPALVGFHARLKALADAGGEPLGQWDALEMVAARLEPLLGGDALGFAPFLRANRAARAEGLPALMLDGVEVPVRGFTEKSRQAIGARLGALLPADAARLDAVTGDWGLIAAYRGA